MPVPAGTNTRSQQPTTRLLSLSRNPNPLTGLLSQSVSAQDSSRQPRYLPSHPKCQAPSRRARAMLRVPRRAHRLSPCRSMRVLRRRSRSHIPRAEAIRSRIIALPRRVMSRYRRPGMPSQVNSSMRRLTPMCAILPRLRRRNLILPRRRNSLADSLSSITDCRTSIVDCRISIATKCQNSLPGDIVMTLSSAIDSSPTHLRNRNRTRIRTLALSRSCNRSHRRNCRLRSSTSSRLWRSPPVVDAAVPTVYLCRQRTIWPSPCLEAISATHLPVHCWSRIMAPINRCRLCHHPS